MGSVVAYERVDVMNVTPDTLAQALASYAVMLNRPQWLDPARLLLQEQVWTRMVDRCPGRAEIRIEDFERSIEEQLVDTPPHAVTPPGIVEAAAAFAEQRRYLADRMVDEFAAGTLMFSEVSKLNSTGDRLAFNQFADQAINALIRSGRPVDQIEELIQAIESTSDATLDRLDAMEALPSVDEYDDRVDLIQNWLSQ